MKMLDRKQKKKCPLCSATHWIGAEICDTHKQIQQNQMLENLKNSKYWKRGY